MIRNQFWHRLPSAPVIAALPQLSWQRDGDGSPASGTAALMIYVALNFMAERHDEPPKAPTPVTPAPVPPGAVLVEPYVEFLGSLPRDRSPIPEDRPGYVAIASYDELATATGLSRSLISQGLERLQELGLISPEGSRQKRIYRITWSDKYFFKLPCAAIVNNGVIQPFKAFTLRSKHELHALKLYLYLAAVRPNDSFFSTASFEKIFERTGISERDIRKASSQLLASGLLSRLDRESSGVVENYGHNKYYLNGYSKLAGAERSKVAEAVAGGSHQ